MVKNAPAIDLMIGPALPDTYVQSTSSAERAAQTHIIQGREAVLAHSELLHNLCERTGQPGAMHCLEYLVTTPTALKKIPTLVLVGLHSDFAPDNATADDLAGAVLLYEYKAVGRRTRLFATDDGTGHRTVIAPLDGRLRLTECVANALIDQGALAVLISLEGDSCYCSFGRKLTASSQMVTRTRDMPLFLPLQKTIEETLATLGRHTRRNLRYYRRRLEVEMGTQFQPQVDMGLAQFLAINRASTNPVPESVARWRYDSIHRTPGAMLVGIRAANGRWLSLVGGRRHKGLTEIDWQVNLAGLPRYSLSTVMRSYLLEHEIELGTTRLTFTGGTPHSMRHSFACVGAIDMVALRRSRSAWFLQKLARWIFPKNNVLGHALRDHQLPWASR